MATKKPLVITNGSLEELQSGDALLAADVSFDGSGTQISSASVQNALAELDNNILIFALALS